MIDDLKIRQHIVRKGESLDSIRRKEHTTMADLAQNNPNLGRNLQPGQVVNFQPAHMTTIVTGWSAITPDFLVRNYNGGRISDYADRVRYVRGKLGT